MKLRRKLKRGTAVERATKQGQEEVLSEQQDCQENKEAEAEDPRTKSQLVSGRTLADESNPSSRRDEKDDMATDSESTQTDEEATCSDSNESSTTDSETSDSDEKSGSDGEEARLMERRKTKVVPIVLVDMPLRRSSERRLRHASSDGDDDGIITTIYFSSLDLISFPIWTQTQERASDDHRDPFSS